LEGTATQGDQSSLDVADRFRLGIEGVDVYAQQLFGNGFASLSPEQQDRILSDLEHGLPATFGSASRQSTPFTPPPAATEAAIAAAADTGENAKAFFALLLAYTVGGFFSDPVHGGNRDMAGWKLIGFPGAQMGYGGQILNYGKPFTGPYISLAQYQQQISGGD
ncbi:MAG: gluconate 2-dehydrogenase subunit 3 family protein, partial [Thermomicrobiales bacterium]|nr:gluconate 2-dehydrogenase subunit 3 family protein [Thermomicrobiales bacterium]